MKCIKDNDKIKDHDLCLSEYVRWGEIELPNNHNTICSGLLKYNLWDEDVMLGCAFCKNRGEKVYISIFTYKQRYWYRMPEIVIKLVVDTIINDFVGVKKISTRINRKNIASLYYYSKLGFTNHGDEWWLDLNNKGDFCISESMNKYEKKEGISVLFLTNNPNTLGLYKWICAKTDAEIFSGKLTMAYLQSLNPKLVISYNYVHIVSQECINAVNENIINMHVSLLPWNRGASPNTWSFIDNTPKGVTIHMLSPELDRGDILFQKELFFNPEKETFETTYERLNEEISQIFKDNWDCFFRGDYKELRKPQREKGSFHSMRDLELVKSQTPFEWTDNIADFLHRYELEKSKRTNTFGVDGD